MQKLVDLCALSALIPALFGGWSTPSYAEFDQDSLVYIQCESSDGKSTSGSGVVVSPHGHVLTAKHVVPDGYSCRGEVGTAIEIPTRPLDRGPASAKYDATILKFDSEPGETFSTVGYVELTDRLQSSRIRAYGFPRAGRSQASARPGAISTTRPDETGMIESTAPTARGMSGGAVILENNGALIGIVGGVPNQDRTGLITDYRVLVAHTIAKELGLIKYEHAFNWSKIDWTALFRLEDLRFEQQGHKLKYRHATIYANYTKKALNSIKWGTPNETGDFENYLVVARRIKESAYRQTMAEWQSSSSGDEERPLVKDFDQVIADLSKSGELIGSVHYQQGSSPKRLGEAVKLMANNTTPRIEGIPAGVSPYKRHSSDNEVVAVIVEWESSVAAPKTEEDKFGALHSYATAHSIMRVTVDDEKRINTDTVRPMMFKNMREPSQPFGDPFTEKDEKYILYDFRGLPRDTKIEIHWGWATALQSPN